MGRGAEIAVLGALSLWLLAAGWLVDVEMYDGFDSIANAHYFLGDAANYQTTRAPLYGWLLVPAVWLKGTLGLHPLDLKPEHLTVAGLGIVYVVGIYAMLVQVHGRRPAVLVAFVAAIPCFLFFSYAPFVSHDLLAGGAALAMLTLAGRSLEAPTRSDWLWLVALGAAAPLLKHTWALNWVIVLIATAASGVSVRAWLRLLAGAVTSAALCWLALSSVIGGAESFWLRPLAQIRFLLDAAPAEVEVPAWIYLRNAFAFGPLSALLVLPGVIFAWRSGRRVERMIAVALVSWWVVLHLMELREVRYGLVVLPLMAAVVVRPLARLLSCRWGAAVITAALAASWLPVHPLSTLSEATRIVAPFYTDSELRAFFVPLETDEGLRAPVLTQGGMLSTTAPEPTPLVADVYHRIFHFGTHHLRVLYGYEEDDVLVLRPPGFSGLRQWDPGAAIVGIRGSVLMNPVDEENLEQLLLLADRVTGEIGTKPVPGGTLLTGAGLADARAGLFRYADVAGVTYGPLEADLLIRGQHLPVGGEVAVRFFRQVSSLR